MSKRKYIVITALTLSLLTVTPVFASPRQSAGNYKGNGKGIVGTVSLINNMNITLAGKNGATYVVDASQAKVKQDKADVSLAVIQPGDTILVNGTISGTTITANTIVEKQSHTAAKRKNVVFGNIINIQDGTFTIEHPAREHHVTTTQTIVTSASTTVKQDTATSSLAGIAVGQHVIVVGVSNVSDGVFEASKIHIVSGSMALPHERSHR